MEPTHHVSENEMRRNLSVSGATLRDYCCTEIKQIFHLIWLSLPEANVDMNPCSKSSCLTRLILLSISDPIWWTAMFLPIFSTEKKNYLRPTRQIFLLIPIIKIFFLVEQFFSVLVWYWKWKGKVKNSLKKNRRKEAKHLFLGVSEWVRNIEGGK